MLKLYKATFICLLMATQVCHAEPQSLVEIDDTIKLFVQHSLSDQYKDKADFTVTVGQLDNRLQLEKCSDLLIPEVEFGNLSQNNFTVKVSCSSPKKWAVRVPIKVQLFKQIVVTTQQLMRDHLIGAADLQLSRQDVSQLSDGYFQSIDELIGMAAQKPIPSGAVIKHHMLKRPTLVHRGEIVKIVISMPGLTIEGTGIAQNDGAKGEMVKVKNSRSNKIVDAMVSDFGATTIPL